MRKLSIKTLLYLMTTLISIALVIPLSFVVLNQNKAIHLLQHEKIGTIIIPQLQQLNILLAEHRGMTNMYLNGNQSLMPKLSILKQKIQLAIYDNQQLCLKYKTSIVLPCDKLTQLNTAWLTLNNNLPAIENFVRHTALIADVRAIQSDVADNSNLSLENSLASYYLMDNMIRTLPDLIEKIAQVRSFGSGILTVKKFTHSEQTQLAKFSYAVHLAMQAELIELNKVFLILPDSKRSLLTILATTEQQINQLLLTADNNIINTDTITMIDEVFFNQATQVLDNVMKLYNPVVNIS
jgi:methyl-accepting chemotaxis protein